MALILISACSNVVVLKDFEVKVKIADSQGEREKGLMNVEYLPEDEGMLFLFENNDYGGFWMKDTLIPLDIIFINERDVVVDIIEAEPCTSEPCEIYSPSEKTLKVLEVNKGLSRKIGLKAGDKVIFSP